MRLRLAGSSKTNAFVARQKAVSAIPVWILSLIRNKKTLLRGLIPGSIGTGLAPAHCSGCPAWAEHPLRSGAVPDILWVQKLLLEQPLQHLDFFFQPGVFRKQRLDLSDRMQNRRMIAPAEAPPDFRQ